MTRTVKVDLTKGKKATIDKGSLALVSKYKWYAHLTPTGKWYARTSVVANGKKKWLWMHRLILGLQGSTIADHRNGNGLDNRKKNLRESTYSRNARNMRVRKHSSKFKGVTWNKRRCRWVAQIELGSRRNVYLGSFAKEVEASRFTGVA